ESATGRLAGRGAGPHGPVPRAVRLEPTSDRPSRAREPSGRRPRGGPPMLLVLAAFAIVPMLLPWIVSRIGPRAFYVAAILPIAAFVHAAVQTPAVLAGDDPFESYDWIPPLG